jgi:hypothetical protein
MFSNVTRSSLLALRQLIRSVAHFGKQAHILDGDHRLVGKGFE